MKKTEEEQYNKQQKIKIKYKIIIIMEKNLR